tara:strand:- start:176 stop:406 length:231 start_codon:yes stop_codon:yes gene_type:complete
MQCDAINQKSPLFFTRKVLTNHKRMIKPPEQTNSTTSPTLSPTSIAKERIIGELSFNLCFGYDSDQNDLIDIKPNK